MIEPELKSYLEKIAKDTGHISKKQTGILKIFFFGVLSGLGYITGAAVGIVLIGYILTVIGVVPALRAESERWRQTIENTTTKQIPSIQEKK